MSEIIHQSISNTSFWYIRSLSLPRSLILSLLLALPIFHFSYSLMLFIIYKLCFDIHFLFIKTAENVKYIVLRWCTVASSGRPVFQKATTTNDRRLWNNGERIRREYTAFIVQCKTIIFMKCRRRVMDELDGSGFS